jgi:ubiquitin-activating enzyme E1
LLTLGQELDMEYLVAAANLHAYNYGIRGTRDTAVFRKVIESMDVPEFTPKSGVKIQINENEPVPQGNDDGELGHSKGSCT